MINLRKVKWDFQTAILRVRLRECLRCECFCQVVPRKGQRLKDLEQFRAVMRVRYSSLQVRYDYEGALRHVLKNA